MLTSRSLMLGLALSLSFVGCGKKDSNKASPSPAPKALIKVPFDNKGLPIVEKMEIKAIENAEDIQTIEQADKAFNSASNLDVQTYASKDEMDKASSQESFCCRRTRIVYSPVVMATGFGWGGCMTPNVWVARPAFFNRCGVGVVGCGFGNNWGAGFPMGAGMGPQMYGQNGQMNEFQNMRTLSPNLNNTIIGNNNSINQNGIGSQGSPNQMGNGVGVGGVGGLGAGGPAGAGVGPNVGSLPASQAGAAPHGYFYYY